MQTLSTALDKARDFVGATVAKVEVLTKPQRTFLVWLFERWLLLPVRYNFLNLSRYGGYSEKAIRTQLSRKLPFVDLFQKLFDGCAKRNVLRPLILLSSARAERKCMGWPSIGAGRHSR